MTSRTVSPATSPAMAVPTFHALYAAGFFGAASPSSSPLPWPSTSPPGLGSQLAPDTEWGISARQASLHMRIVQLLIRAILQASPPLTEATSPSSTTSCRRSGRYDRHSHSCPAADRGTAPSVDRPPREGRPNCPIRGHCSWAMSQKEGSLLPSSCEPVVTEAKLLWARRSGRRCWLRRRRCLRRLRWRRWRIGGRRRRSVARNRGRRQRVTRRRRRCISRCGCRRRGDCRCAGC